MRVTYPKRLQLAHWIADALPWASVVCGARGYSFISIDRGETVSYSGTDGRKSWAGSYPPVGSREVHVLFGQEIVQALENITPQRGEAQRCKILCEQRIPVFDWRGRRFLPAAVDDIVPFCESWITPVDAVSIVLPPGHRLVINKHPLEPLEVQE